ncbi:uncharacterized protein MONOS_10275 [Monocercomonoides exilis]|uniref:uncharacterized protein n=1 Tax=Monocercomonoides exilis TaxID=2049356 RepID=UPI00355A732C|nr:hypothetical protein MONOS_10275 [Monocercomonoides exilis]|eukprot:MONOS_10275.1-p1 / transcript=MONOS_10275.1 / gene=MONOS_10275 / organism=Monocercomonoides_exilis_PA203 / gene_product=unspecified product / transcript_product=unspecified product / location=Mono_scaffold00460:1507-1872(-) / protein_length=122 / sequence_SO=supercontig / SO=protein_coding / is_pseudo=false
MTSPQNNSVSPSPDSSASSFSPFPSSSSDTTFSNVAASFSSHGKPISLQSPSISPSAESVNVDSTHLWMLDTIAIGQKVVRKRLWDLWKWAIQNVLKGERRKRESWNWQHINQKQRCDGLQ